MDKIVRSLVNDHGTEASINNIPLQNYSTESGINLNELIAEKKDRREELHAFDDQLRTKRQLVIGSKSDEFAYERHKRELDELEHERLAHYIYNGLFALDEVEIGSDRFKRIVEDEISARQKKVDDLSNRASQSKRKGEDESCDSFRAQADEIRKEIEMLDSMH